MTYPFTRLCFLCAASSLLIACGDDGPSMMDMDGGMLDPDAGPMVDGGVLPNVDGGTPGFYDTVEERLDHLSIALPDLDSAEVGGTAIRDLHGDAMPDGAHPLREPIATLTGADELYVTGTGPGGGVVVDLDRPGIAGADRHVVARPAGAFEFLTQQAVVALHLDDDGREEVLVFDVRAPSDDVLVFEIDDEETGYATNGFAGDTVGSWPGATGIQAVRWDAEGDGVDEVYLAAIVGADVAVRSYDPATKTLGAVETLVRLGSIREPIYAVSLASGPSDDAPGDEVAVLVNHRERSGSTGTSRLKVLGTSFDREVIMEDGRTIVGASVAMADIDGDFRDEVLVGGGAPNANPGSYELRLTARDDAAAGLGRVLDDSFVSAVESNSMVRIRQSQLTVATTSLPAVAPSLPGPPPPAGFQAFDPVEDVMVNNVLWEFAPATIPAGATPAQRVAAMVRAPREVFAFGSESELIVDRDNVQFALGQLDGDGLPDAAVLAETAGLFQDATLGDNTLAKRSLLGRSPIVQTQLRPDGRLPMVMVQANTDSDSIVVRHLEDQHEMRYSEPVILAVLAAAPCYAGPDGQYTNECSTTFGNTTSSAVATDSTFGFSMGVTVGFGFEDRTFSQSELKATATVSAHTSFTTGERAEISFSRSYSNGAPQNQVLATVFGLEQFTYRILSAPPGPNGEIREGETITVSIPRSDVQTTRLFSESLIRPSLRPSQAAALDAVFDHTPTDPSSYHRRSELGAYMAGLGITGPACDESTSPSMLGSCGYLTSLDGIDPGTVTIPGGVRGSGTGADGTIQVSNSTDRTEAWGTETVFDLELSAGGAIFGLHAGVSTESSITVSHGTSVEYGFRAGAVDPGVYAPYQANIVAFRHRFDCNASDECQSFEVLNFWTETSTP